MNFGTIIASVATVVVMVVMMTHNDDDEHNIDAEDDDDAANDANDDDDDDDDDDHAHAHAHAHVHAGGGGGGGGGVRFLMVINPIMKHPFFPEMCRKRHRDARKIELFASKLDKTWPIGCLRCLPKWVPSNYLLGPPIELYNHMVLGQNPGTLGTLK